MRTSAYCYSIVLLMAAVFVPRAGAQLPCVDDTFTPDQAIVRVAPPLTVDDAVAALEGRVPGLTASVIDSIPARAIYLLALSAPGGVDESQLEQQFFDPNSPTTLLGDGSDPNRPLVWSELDYSAETAEGKTGSGYVSRPAMTAALYQTQYVAGMIGVPAAQALSTGGSTVVAILDTGIDATHPALGAAVQGSGYNFVLNNTDTRDLGDNADNDGDGMTDEGVGHGTFVAGIVHLVAPEAQILPVVVLDSEGRSGLFRIAKGLFFAIDRGVEVINMSLGSTYDSTAVEDALGEAALHGITVVGSAGNCNTDQRQFPAAKRKVLGVVAVDDTDHKASFSSYGTKMFISAPGDSVPDGNDPTGWDTTRSMFGPVPGGSYAAWEGTSLAAPLVAGAAALIRAQHPEWSADAGTTDEIANLLANAAVDIYPQNPGFSSGNQLGAGRLDAGAAVLLGPPEPAPGDLNNDGVVNIVDLARVLADFGLVHSSADINANGMVDVGDLAIVLSRLGACPGDVDGDGVVSLSDLGVVLANFGTAAGATLADGDVNGDGMVNLTDLGQVLAAFGTQCV